MDETKNLTDPMTTEEKLEFKERFDSFVNVLLRNGTDGGDITTPDHLMTLEQLETLYVNSPTARRIVDIYPEEMFRAGFTIKGAPDGFDMDDFKSRWEELDLDSKLITAFCWARLYGGGGLLLGTVTGSDFNSPLDPAEELDFVRVLGAPEMNGKEDGTISPQAALSGLPEVWDIKPILGGTTFDVHNSRVLFDSGKAMPPGRRMKEQKYFGLSVLQGLGKIIHRYDQANQWANLILARLQQGVWKSEGLSDLCDTDAGFRTVQRRLNMVDSTRSASNTIAIDSTEEYSLLTGTLAGVTDLLKELRAQLSLYTGIPEMAFSSSVAGGLANSAEGPLQMFWSTTAREQKLRATPMVQRLVTMITGLDKFTIEWNPLAEETITQAADRLQKNAQADAAYITNGVLSVEEIRDTLAQRGDYVMGAAPPPPPRQPAPANAPTPTNTPPANGDA